MAPRVEQAILWFHVSVDDAVVVRTLQREGQLRRVKRDRRRREDALLAEMMKEFAARAVPGERRVASCKGEGRLRRLFESPEGSTPRASIRRTPEDGLEDEGHVAGHAVRVVKFDDEGVLEAH